MADGTSSLNPIAWGTSTGGAAGSSESTLTLGVDRTDVRTPPDSSHLWAAQISAIKNLALAMSQTFKGGTRLGTLTQSSNPFSASETGFYVDTNGAPWLSYNGATSKLTGIVAAAQDVASTGASTTLVTLTSPVSGIYRVSIVVSAHTNNDTVTATITYTDAVESFATTLTPISSVALTHDSNTGTTSSTSIIRASAATNIVATLSVTAQTTTKASVVIERLN